VFNADGSVKFTKEVFAGFTGGIRTASADVNNDAIIDIIAAAGPGMNPEVRILDGNTGDTLTTIQAFESSFRGGLYVVSADLNGDGFAEIVISPDEGGGPRVRVLSGKDQTSLADFFGIEDTNFRGGARVTLGDVNGDGVLDLLVGAGFGGGPRLAVFDGKSLLSGTPKKLFNDFFVFEQTLRNGVFLTSGDINGDKFAEVVVGGGPGGGPRIFALSGKDLIAGVQTQVANFFAGDLGSRGGVRITVKDLDNDGLADILAGSGVDSGASVLAYSGKSIPQDGTPPVLDQFDAFEGFEGGVFVG